MTDQIKVSTQRIWWQQLFFYEQMEAIQVWKDTDDGFPDHRKTWEFTQINENESVLHELYNLIKKY